MQRSIQTKKIHRRAEESPKGCQRIYSACTLEGLILVSESRQASIQVYKGDLVHTGQPLHWPSGLLVTGSVGDGVRLDAQGDVYIRGHVHGSSISSAGGRVAVTDTTLSALTDILCGPLDHATLQAGGDIHLLAEARHSALQAAGNLHVKLSMEYSLQRVQTQIGGGLVLNLQMPPPSPATAGERQHVRAPARLEGAIALHGAPPFRFQPCVIEDFSAGGLRCTVPDGALYGVTAAGTLVQIKFQLPGEQSQILAIARVARMLEGGSVGLAFLSMAEHDGQRLKAYCLQLILTGKHRKLDLRHNRTSDLQQESLFRRRSTDPARTA